MIQFPRPPSARRSLPAAAADRHYRLRRHRAGHSDDRPAVAAQLAAQWQLGPAQIGHLFSTELGAMSTATLPAWWWIGRINWRRVATLSALVFIVGNGFGAGAGFYPAAAAALYRLTGGRHPDDPVHHLRRRHRQSQSSLCLLGARPAGAGRGRAAGAAAAVRALRPDGGLPDSGAIMLCCLPLIPAFPNGFTAARTARSGPAASPARKLCAVLAVLTFTSA